MAHSRNELVALLRDELGPDARERVEAHLQGCADCRQEREAFAEILAGLRAAPVPVPDPHWGRYGVELREKLETRKSRRPWWAWPLPVAFSTAVAGALVAVLMLTSGREPARPDLTRAEETVLGERLDMLRQYPVVERLDLLEDLEVIRQLDRLEPSAEG